MIAAPSSRSPLQQPRTITKDWPRNGSGTSSIGGKFISTKDDVSRSSCRADQARQRRMTSRAMNAG